MPTNEEHLPLFNREDNRIIKAIAILCVFICHLGNQFTRMTTPLGGIGVCMFLIMSGYGLEKSFLSNLTSNNKVGGGTLNRWWTKRIIAVFVPYWIVSIFAISLKGFSYPFSLITLKELLLDITLITPKFGLGWYLSYLLLWYCIFWITHRFIVVQQARNAVIGFATLGLFVYFGFTSGIRFEQSFAFPLGVMLANYEDKFKKYFTRRVMFVLMIVGIGLLGIKQLDAVRVMPEVVLNILNLVMKESLGITIIIGIKLILKIGNDQWNKTGIYKLLKSIGMASYELYLVHGYTLEIFRLNWNRWLCVMLFIVISVVGTCILYFIDSRVNVALKKKFVIEK